MDWIQTYHAGTMVIIIPYIIETTKMDAGISSIPITSDVVDIFRAIIKGGEPQ